jgi:Kef-type K+ transport system membrane component KefB
MEGNTLILLAVLIFFSKIISDLFSRINLPPVLGMILIGLLIGPTGFNLIGFGEEFTILGFFAEIGVIILLFLAGLETDIEQMKKIGKNAFFIALGGVIFPLIFGFGITYAFYFNSPDVFSVGLIMGIILTATSVSVTVISLMDMKKLKTVEGNTILGAAIIDDIIGILMLTFVLGIIGGTETGASLPLWQSILIILGFIVGAVAIGVFVIPWLLNLSEKLRVEKPLIATALAIVFIYSWVAQKAEIAEITGAYMAGVFIGQTRFKHKIEEGISTIGQALFVSIFFVFIGIETNLRGQINWLFALLFSLCAIISKLFGAGVIAKGVGFDWRRSMRIGSGMVPRGEVALVIATIVSGGGAYLESSVAAEGGVSSRMGLLSNEHFSAVVVMVILSAFVTPFLLRLFFREKDLVKNP